MRGHGTARASPRGAGPQRWLLPFRFLYVNVCARDERDEETLNGRFPHGFRRATFSHTRSRDTHEQRLSVCSSHVSEQLCTSRSPLTVCTCRETHDSTHLTTSNSRSTRVVLYLVRARHGARTHTMRTPPQAVSPHSSGRQSSGRIHDGGETGAGLARRFAKLNVFLIAPPIMPTAAAALLLELAPPSASLRGVTSSVTRAASCSRVSAA